MKWTIAAAMAATLVTSASSALCDTQGPADVTKSGDALVYDFRDTDALNASANGATGAMIRVKTTVLRRTLIRPRASFVQELVKSVEHI